MKWSGWYQVNKWWVVDEQLPYMGNDGGSHAHSVHSKKCQPVERLHWDCIVKVPTGWRVFHKESIWFLQRVEEIHSTHSKGREGFLQRVEEIHSTHSERREGFLQRVEESSSKVNGGKLQRVEVFPMLFNREFTRFIAKHDNECHIHDRDHVFFSGHWSTKVLQIAEKYNCDFVKNIVGVFLENIVNIENAHQIWTTADESGMRSLMEAAQKFLANTSKESVAKKAKTSAWSQA